MPIKEATRVGGGAGYVDLQALAGEAKSTSPDDGTIAIFRIVSFDDDDPQPGEYGWDMPVTADVLVVESEPDPEQDGRVWLRQRIRFAPVYVLRGHAKPDAKVRLRDLPKPVNEVGDEIITRIQRKGSGKGFVALQVPSKEDKRKALALRESLGGDSWGLDGEDDAPF
jgi:hypothetical protein